MDLYDRLMEMVITEDTTEEYIERRSLNESPEEQKNILSDLAINIKNFLKENTKVKISVKTKGFLRNTKFIKEKTKYIYVDFESLGADLAVGVIIGLISPITFTDTVSAIKIAQIKKDIKLNELKKYLNDNAKVKYTIKTCKWVGSYLALEIG